MSFHHQDNLCYRVVRTACHGRPGHYLSGSTGDPAVTSWPEALGPPVPCYHLGISHSLTGRGGMDDCDTGCDFFFFFFTSIHQGAKASFTFSECLYGQTTAELVPKTTRTFKSTEPLSFLVLESLQLWLFFNIVMLCWVHFHISAVWETDCQNQNLRELFV